MSEGSKIFFCQTCKRNTNHDETVVSPDHSYRKCADCCELSERVNRTITVIKEGTIARESMTA